jgi:hypothetical protein
VGRRNVALLALLRAARQQNHQRFAVAPEIDAVSRPEVDPVFEHAFANRFDVGEVTVLQPNKSSRDLGAQNRLQFRKLLREGLHTAGGHVVAKLGHGHR